MVVKTDLCAWSELREYFRKFAKILNHTNFGTFFASVWLFLLTYPYSLPSFLLLSFPLPSFLLLGVYPGHGTRFVTRSGQMVVLLVSPTPLRQGKRKVTYSIRACTRHLSVIHTPYIILDLVPILGVTA